MKVIAHHGDEKFTLIIDSLCNIRKKIIIIDDKNVRKFNIITIETVFKQGLFDFQDVKNQKLCTIEEIKIYLEEI